MEVLKPKPLKEKCHKCCIKGRVCIHGRPYTQCVTREIECKPYKPRYRVSLEEKCSRCFKRRWAYNGKDPCNRCLEDKVPYISQMLVNSPKCTYCQGKRLRYDRKRPCYNYIKKKRVCSYFDDNNLIWRVYATDETKFRDEDKDKYK